MIEGFYATAEANMLPPPAYSSAFRIGHNGHNHPFSVSAKLAEIMRAGKYPDQ
jgi:hypothetical protein